MKYLHANLLAFLVVLGADELVATLPLPDGSLVGVLDYSSLLSHAGPGCRCPCTWQTNKHESATERIDWRAQPAV